MIDEKKLDDFVRIIALASMDIFKDNPYRNKERKLARDIWINGIIVGEEKDRTEPGDKDFEEPEEDDIERE